MYQMKLCSQSLYDENNDKQLVLFDISVRLFICCMTAICSTVLNLIFFSVLDGIDPDFYGVIGTLPIASIDTLINAVCLLFQWPQFNKYYKKCFICTLCHQCVQNKFIKAKMFKTPQKSKQQHENVS